MTDLLAGTGSIIFGVSLVREIGVSDKWGMAGLALLAVDAWFGVKALGKIRAWWAPRRLRGHIGIL